MSIGPDAEPLSLATELSSVEAEAAWQEMAEEHGLAVSSLSELLGNSAVFTDVMVGGPAMGDEQSQEGGYNASLKNKAEAAAARGDTDAQPMSGEGLMVVGPLMSSIALRQVCPPRCHHCIGLPDLVSACFSQFLSPRCA